MRRPTGFTLIELMVVLIIVGLLLALAVPAFTEQIRKSRRAEAVRGLSDMQLRQEQWRANHTTYAPANTAAAGNPPNGIPLPTSQHYTFAVTAGSNTATDVVMTATPAGAQAADRCGTFTLRIDNNNDNNPPGMLDKTVSGSATDCW